MVELIRTFFKANQIIILSVYGQVFFVLGLVIALQSWRHSRLALARSLTWLAAFGLLHGLHEWGHVFIPIQAQYLAPPFIDILRALQVVLLAISFACLFQFGLETMRPLPNKLHLLRYLPGAMLVVWIFIAFGPTSTTVDDWYTLNNILARYLLGFSGALVAAYGLRYHAQRLVAPMEMPHIGRTLQVAGLTLAGYGVMTGLIVPPANFFPANWLNTVWLEELTLIPVQLYRSLLGVVLIVTMLRALEVFRVELDRRLNSMEESQMLTTERERLGRELHDGTLQTIYAAGLILRTSEKDLQDAGISPKNLNQIQQTVIMLDAAVTEIREYIGTLRNPSTSTSRSLANGLMEIATSEHLNSLVKIDLRLDLPDDKTMQATRVGHLLAITNEALSNVARHAQATHVELSAIATNNRLCLKIEDNGQGLPVDYLPGYGLRNMRDRARMLGGSMDVETKPGHSTTLTLEVPWSEDNEKITTITG